eukprot:3653267-Pleurochrysis_carterae.AAC.2
MCLDLAAARGMRGCQAARGRKAGRSFPAMATSPTSRTAIPSYAGKRPRKSFGRVTCSFNGELMFAESLRAAAHLPPLSWDFHTDGPWKCLRCGETVWGTGGRERRLTWNASAWMSCGSGRTQLTRTSANPSPAFWAAADTHLDQLYVSPPVVYTGTDVYIVDPMHALKLDVCKTAFKYSFMDKVDDVKREKVSAYFQSWASTFTFAQKENETLSKSG